MPTLKAVIYQILDTAKTSSDPANVNRVRTMFFEEYAIIARRALENYGMNSQYVQNFEMETEFSTTVPVSMKLHSTNGMRRTKNLVPPIINNKIADHVSLSDSNGKLYTVMTDSAFKYKDDDPYLVSLNPALKRNGYLWFPGTLSTDTLTINVEAPFANPVQALDYETTLGLSIEDDMELPIPSNIISVVKLQVLLNNFGVGKPQQQAQ